MNRRRRARFVPSFENLNLRITPSGGGGGMQSDDNGEERYPGEGAQASDTLTWSNQDDNNGKLDWVGSSESAQQ